MDPAEDMDELGADMGGLVLHPNGDLLTWVRECGDPQTMSARLAEEAAAMEDKRKCRRGLSLPPNLNFACCEGCVALELPGTLVNEKDCHDGNQSRGFCCCGSPGEGACLADSGALAEILEGRHACDPVISNPRTAAETFSHTRPVLWRLAGARVSGRTRGGEPTRICHSLLCAQQNTGDILGSVGSVQRENFGR